MKHTLYVLSTKEDDWDLWMFYEKAAHADFAGEVVLGLSTKTPQMRRSGIDWRPIRFLRSSLWPKTSSESSRCPDTHQAQIHGKEGVFTERYDRESCMNRLDEYQE
ncbi:hypothetical protein CSPAE12_04517 [Colletotrichum incanum]|nr:hypothetical protein CSPAE12_04517 [Colletotrichum incanum]